MQEKLLKEIVVEVAGTNISEKLVDLLQGKKNVNEFLIAKKLNLTINQTRNILYRLGDLGLVSFIRKKDSKKGGWYIYFWTLNSAKALELLKERVLSRVQSYESEFQKRSSERFYYSPDADIEYTEEQALENNFICPETGGVLELKDNTSVLKSMEKDISMLRTMLSDVDLQLTQIYEKEQKSRERVAKNDAKKKAKERAEKRSLKAKAKAKAVKKSGKKVSVKKKVSKKSTGKKSVLEKKKKSVKSKKSVKKK